MTKVSEQCHEIVTVVAAGENKDLQDPAGHRLREVRGFFYGILPSQVKKVTRFHIFFTNSNDTNKLDCLFPFR